MYIVIAKSPAGGAPRVGVRVRTSIPDGRKYVNSDERIRSKKAKRQMRQLRKIMERKKPS